MISLTKHDVPTTKHDVPFFDKMSSTGQLIISPEDPLFYAGSNGKTVMYPIVRRYLKCCSSPVKMFLLKGWGEVIGSRFSLLFF